jgi:outer membrane protein assembly factor BamB
MKRTVLATVALAMVAVLMIVPRVGSAQSAPSWSTFHGNAGRSGSTTVNGPSDLKHLNIWAVPPSTLSSPSVGPNNVGYIGDNDGNLYAFDPAHPAAALWSFKTGGPIVDAPTISSDGTRVFVGSDDGFVYAINAANGSKIWSTDMSGAVEGSPTLSSDGSTLYVSNIAGTVKALIASSGQAKWSAAPGVGIRGSLALSPDGSTLYAGTTSQEIIGIPSGGPGGGASLTVFYLDGQPISSPSVDSNSNIYITTTAGTVLSFSPSSPTPRWTFAIAGMIPSLSTPAIANGNVYVGAGNGNIYALSASSGTQQWQQHTNAAIESSPAVGANGNVYVGSDDGSMYAFDSTGKQFAKLAIGPFVSSSPALAADGTVWIASQSGQLARLGALALPATPPGTPTAGPSPTPTITPTLGPTSTPSPSPTATTPPVPTLAVTGKSSVKPGAAQKITIHTVASSAVHIVVTFPNGTHQTATKQSDATGTAVYNFHQKGSEITHSRSTASVVVTVGSASNTFKYTIGYGTIDVSAEPRTVTAGKGMSIYIHEKPKTRVLAVIKYSNGRVDQKTGTPGPKGWAHVKYTVPKNVPKGKTVTVTARLLHGSSKVSASTTFTVR